MVKYDNKWHHMKHSHLAKKTEEKVEVKYYHILINNYFENTLVANGVEAESYYDPKYNNNIELQIKCSKTQCSYVIDNSINKHVQIKSPYYNKKKLFLNRL